MPSASRIDALSGSRLFAFSSATVAWAGACRPQGCPALLEEAVRRRRLPHDAARSTSSRIAAAISLFGACGTTRSPAAETSVTSLSASVEADARLRDVVEDEEVGALALELPARAIEAALACLGGEADEDLAGRFARAERREDVGRRLELERPRLGVLRTLRGERRRRAVVGDGRRHDDRRRPRRRGRAPRARGRPRSASRRARRLRAPARRGSPRAA